MKHSKKFLSLFVLFSIIHFGLPLSSVRAIEPTPQFPIYLEIQEDNVDSFPVPGHTEGAETLNPPFWIENGKVLFDPELADSIAKGEEKQTYNLLIAPKKFDEKSVKLLVKHEIRYEGKGRNSETAHYYMFDTWPAVIPFAPVTIDRTQVNIDLEENEEKLLNIRLTEESLTVLYDDFSGNLRCQYGQVKSDLPKDRVWEISEKSQKISISRQMTTTHRIKDPSGQGLPESTRRDFGEVEFKTKLTLKNLGAFSLA